MRCACRAATHFQNPFRTGNPDLPLDGRSADGRRSDVAAQDFEIFGVDAAVVSSQLIERLGLVLEAEVALEMGIDLDHAVGVDEQGPRRRRAQQGRSRAGTGEDGIGAGDPPRRHDEDERRDRQPEGGEDDDDHRRAATHDRRCLSPPAMNGS